MLYISHNKRIHNISSAAFVIVFVSSESLVTHQLEYIFGSSSQRDYVMKIDISITCYKMGMYNVYFELIHRVALCCSLLWFNTMKPRDNDRHFADDISKCIFLNENVWIPMDISLKFVPMGHINNIPSLAQIMACRLVGTKPLSDDA